jgi:hypothetical protein
MQTVSPQKTRLRKTANVPQNLILLQFATAGLIAGAALAVAVATLVLEHGKAAGF